MDIKKKSRVLLKFAYIYFLIKVLFASLPALSNNSTYQFGRFDNKHLSNNHAYTIYRDSRGFMWFATKSGLNRFDGNVVKLFNQGSKIFQSPFYRISMINEDKNGNLWMKESDTQSYTMYEWKTETFHSKIDSLMERMGLPLSPTIIKFDDSKNIYLYYESCGILKYSENGVPVIHLLRKEDKKELDNYAVGAGKLWLFYKNGSLKCVETDTGKIVTENEFFVNTPFHPSSIPKSMYVDTDGELWIYPASNDRNILHVKVNGESQVLTEKTQPALSNNFIRTITQDNDGLIWIGTDHGGINIFDKRSNTMKYLFNEPSNPRSISSNSVITLYYDHKSGIMWGSTFKNNLFYYHPNIYKFDRPQFLGINEEFDCNSFLRDSKGNLWIGTNGYGLILQDNINNTKRYFKFNQDNTNSLSSNIITSLYEDHQGTIWIGTFLGGLNAWRDGQIIRQPFGIETGNLLKQSVYDIQEDEQNNLWIATLGSGLYRFDPASNKYFVMNRTNSPELVSDYIVAMTKCRNGKIYLCTSQGINILDTRTSIISKCFDDHILASYINNALLNDIICDSDSNLWIATDNGLIYYNQQAKSFTHINILNGLPNNEVVFVLEDEQNNIWAGTRNGLACISFNTNGILNVVTFTENDGLPGNIFNTGAAYIDVKGKLYTGLANGYAIFNPNSVLFNDLLPVAKFTELKIGNTTLFPGEKYFGRVILKESISNTRKIILNYGESNIKISFSAMNYIHPEKTQYRYRLDGFEDEWHTVDSRNAFAAYSSLPQGIYTLIVYATNNDGVWSKEPLKMEITVNPPFWKSFWAIIVYIAIVITIMLLFSQIRFNKQQKRHKQEQELLEIRKRHEVDELKIKFFTNISHEIKTPLTLIISPLEQLLIKETSPERHSILEIMYRNAKSLVDMVNDILDLKKLDISKMTLQTTKGDIIAFIRNICYSFSNLSNTQGIKLSFTAGKDVLIMDFDPDKISKVISNLLSNAFKYTKYGTIDVGVYTSEIMGPIPKKWLQIAVSDTGIGIPEDEKYKIFDRFYRIENNYDEYTGSGIGLHLANEFVRLHGGYITVESEPDKGSKFQVWIPLYLSEDLNYMNTKNTDYELNKRNVSDIEDNECEEESCIEDNPKPLLLIVDDNIDFRRFVSSIFFDTYRIITASDGQNAFFLATQKLPDLILTDVMMPKVDGYELCRNIKNDIRTSHIPVILLTAKTSDESKYLGIESGADDYISKPFDVELLKLKITKIIERQQKMYECFHKRIDISLNEVEIITMDEEFVRKAVAIVEKHIEDPDFLVKDLYTELNVSRVCLYKKILALTNKTPSEFIKFIRIKRAEELLRKSQMYVNEIAYKVGFNDTKNFRNCFKKEFGITPSEYKKNFEKE